MKGAVGRLKQLTETKTKTGEVPRPSSPEIAKEIAILCRPDEAEGLRKLSTDDDEALSDYGRSVATVMSIYSDAGDRARSQRTITDYTRDLGLCFDATLWVTLATLEQLDKMIVETPKLSKDPEGKRIVAKARATAPVVLEGALEAFQLNGIGAAWCEARLQPVLALTDAVSRIVSPGDKEKLRAVIRTSEQCGPAAKEGLQAAHRSLGAFAASAQAVDAERLQAMRKAVANLEYLASLKESSRQDLPPSSPEAAGHLATICNPKEAESLGQLAPAQFEAIRTYSQYLTAVLKLFTRPSASPSARFAPEIEPCIDADLWIGRASLNLVKRMFVEKPAAWQDAKMLNGRRKMWLSGVVTMHIVLRAFRMPGVEPAWCEARMRPLLALAEVVLEEVPPGEREKLREALLAAETCGPAVAPELRALAAKLTP